MSNITRLNDKISAQEFIEKYHDADNILIVAVKGDAVYSWYKNDRFPFTMIGAIENIKRYFLYLID